MKILFSPSEAKSHFTDAERLNQNSLSFDGFFNKRLEILNMFTLHVKNIPKIELSKFFGIKDEKECEVLSKLDLLNEDTTKAINRYTGVAYKHLNFDSLNNNQKQWIENNTIIFSNLFGPILAKDNIPYYRFKQGSAIDGFKTENFYKEHFSSTLDDFIADELVIDLRAGFYEKFYKIKSKHIKMKFLKDGKVVSHWAKAYRGLILRDLSKYQPQTIEEFENINFKGLIIEKIIENNKNKEYFFKINV